MADVVSEDPAKQVRIDPDLLWSLGYRSLTRSQVVDLLSEIYDTLEQMVGTRLAESLDENQLARFEKIVAGHDETQALAWIRANIPAYREVVRLEFDHMVSTLRAARDFRKLTTRQDQQAPTLSNTRDVETAPDD